MVRRLILLSALAMGCGGSTAAEDETPSSDSAGVDVQTPPSDADDDTAVAEDTSTTESDTAEPADVGGPVDATPDAPPLPPAANSVHVYTINIENMIFDWKDLIHFMERQPRNPDIVLVQQMTNRRRLDEMLAFMSSTLGEKYEGVVAQNDPTHNRFQGEVIPRPQVTTGVIWRSARFNLLKQEKWFPWGAADGSGGHTCASRTGNSGYQTIRVELDDVLAKRRVAATSLRHWTWMDCSEKNMIEMVDGLASGPNAHTPMPDYALQLVGGDFNGTAFTAADAYKCWYQVSNHALDGKACSGHANLGYADPLYEQCKGVKTCVAAQSGIDFIFARKTGGKPARTSNYDVITYADGDAADKAATGSDGLSNKAATQGFNDVNSNYSEHRARRATFYYE